MAFDKLENILLKAKVELMNRSVFISTIALSVKHIITEKVPTAATNGTRIYYNPNFIKKLSIQELAGLIAHECWHIAFQHLARKKERIPNVWNAAADYVINNLLTKNGFCLPEGGLIDNRFDDCSTEEVYKILLDENKNNKSNNFNTIILDLYDAPDERDAQGNPITVDEQDIKNILVRAATQAKMANKDIGSLPGEIGRIIEDLTNPKLDWAALLIRFITNTQKNEYTWNRKNRRFTNYLPSMRGHGLEHLTFAIDTSGSVSDEELKELLSEIKGIRDTFNPEKMTIIDCDYKIHNVFEVDQNTDILSLEFTGGGGTSFHPVIEYVKENPTAALIYFTDLYGDTDIGEINFPLLWICNSDHSPPDIGETIYLET